VDRVSGLARRVNGMCRTHGPQRTNGLERDLDQEIHQECHQELEIYAEMEDPSTILGQQLRLKVQVKKWTLMKLFPKTDIDKFEASTITSHKTS